MKKLICTFVALMLLVCAVAVAETAFVSISDSTGNLVLAREAIELSDMDEDGVLSIHDALTIAHDLHFEGGSEAGYLAEDLGYGGLSLCMLWGEDNSGSFGYFVDDASAMILTEPVADGSHIKAYSYTDLETWSDAYCYFQTGAAEIASGDNLVLTLTALVYDANWNMVETPVEGAVITINGADSEFVTNADGCAAISLSEVGKYVISARSETMTLVPPVCVVSVS